MDEKMILVVDDDPCAAYPKNFDKIARANGFRAVFANPNDPIEDGLGRIRGDTHGNIVGVFADSCSKAGSLPPNVSLAFDHIKRFLEIRPDLPIAVHSGRRTKSLVQQAQQAGATSYYLKGESIEPFFEEVRRRLDHSEIEVHSKQERSLGSGLCEAAPSTSIETVDKKQEATPRQGRRATESTSAEIDAVPSSPDTLAGDLNELRPPRTGAKHKQLASNDQVLRLRQEIEALNKKINIALEPCVRDFQVLLMKADFGLSPDRELNQETVEALAYVASRLEQGFACPKEAVPEDGSEPEIIASTLRCYKAPGMPEGAVTFEHPKKHGPGKHGHGGFATWAELLLVSIRKAFAKTR